MSENTNNQEQTKTERIYISKEDVLQLINLKFNVLQDENTNRYYIESQEVPNTKNPNVKTQGITQEQLDLVTIRHVFFKELGVIQSILLMFKDKKESDMSQNDIKIRDNLNAQLYYILKYLVKNQNDFKLGKKDLTQLEINIESIEIVAQFNDFDLTKYEKQANDKIKQVLDQLVIDKNKDKDKDKN